MCGHLGSVSSRWQRKRTHLLIAQVMNRVMNMPPPSLSGSGFSSDLVDFVKRCLVKDVSDRASVEELLKVVPLE